MHFLPASQYDTHGENAGDQQSDHAGYRVHLHQALRGLVKIEP